MLSPSKASVSPCVSAGGTRQRRNVLRGGALNLRCLMVGLVRSVRRDKKRAEKKEAGCKDNAAVRKRQTCTSRPRAGRSVLAVGAEEGRTAALHQALDGAVAHHAGLAGAVVHAQAAHEVARLAAGVAVVHQRGAAKV